MNSVNLTGRLTSDVELKQTTNGVAVCTFTIAVKRPKVKDTTDFIRCVAWRNTAEFVTRYFKKGQEIAITGCLTTRTYEDKGNKRTAYEVVCENCEFCGSKASSDSGSSEFETVESGDDLPF